MKPNIREWMLMTSLREMVNQFGDVSRDPCDEEIVGRAREILDYFNTGIPATEPANSPEDGTKS